MKLSIITINYNNAIGLKKTIESVVNQTYTDFEYIVIDGGSTDGSLEVIKDYEHKITYWVSEPDAGIYNAMNKGIKKATGEYLLFLNGDDYFINNKVLEHNIDCFNNADIIYFNIKYQNDNETKEIVYQSKLSFYFFYTQTLCHQAVFFRSTLFNEMGVYDENLKIVSDWKFIMLAIVKYGAKYKHINQSICVFDNRGISNTENNNQNNIDKHILERHQVLESEFPMFLNDYENYQLLKFYFEKYKLNKIKKLLRLLKF